MHARWDLRAAAPRLPGLLAGLAVFGLGIALMAEAGLGLGPWEALHEGVGRIFGVPLGTVSIALGIPILALWWPLGERPGIGTLLNVVLIGTATNAGLLLFPRPPEPAIQLAMMLCGVLVIGVGSGLYLAADLGPGPRDGLMTGVHRRFGWSIRRARTAIEVAVLVVAWALGGTIGLGTVVFALGIGPVVQVFLGVFDREGRVQRRRRVELGGPGTVGE
ncbi:MAG TPA: YitT family protein [Candidatus Limnocylindrales bacterium]|nr:YitT family protein [Candidatus Limnocylindrales bacterium]